ARLVRTRTNPHRLAVHVTGISSNNSVRASKIKQHPPTDLWCTIYDDVHCDLVRKSTNNMQQVGIHGIW
ncbi:MAG: hypothetical protein ACO20J_07905, partial [Ilumatobacteraceae bacterium]